MRDAQLRRGGPESAALLPAGGKVGEHLALQRLRVSPALAPRTQCPDRSADLRGLPRRLRVHVQQRAADLASRHYGARRGLTLFVNLGESLAYSIGRRPRYSPRSTRERVAAWCAASRSSRRAPRATRSAAWKLLQVLAVFWPTPQRLRKPLGRQALNKSGRQDLKSKGRQYSTLRSPTPFWRFRLLNQQLRQESCSPGTAHPFPPVPQNLGDIEETGSYARPVSRRSSPVRYSSATASFSLSLSAVPRKYDPSTPTSIRRSITFCHPPGPL